MLHAATVKNQHVPRLVEMKTVMGGYLPAFVE